MKFTKDTTFIVKGIAIILMIIFHGLPNTQEIISQNLHFFGISADKIVWIAGFGQACVCIFLFVSVYGLVNAYQKESQIEDSTIKRWIKLILNFQIIYIIALAFSFLGRNPIDIYGTGTTGILYAIIDFFGLAHLFKTPLFNGIWWYMSLATVIIFVVPLLIKIYKKEKWLAVILSLLIPRILGIHTEYLFTMMVAIYCADTHIFDKITHIKITSNCIVSNILKFLIYSVLFFFCLYGRQRWYLLIPELWNTIIPILTIAFTIDYINQTKYIKKGLSFIGIHSMNIFMLHSFVQVYYLHQPIYALQNIGLIIMVTLFISLLLSVLLEEIKKKIHFEKFIEKVQIMTIRLLHTLERTSS